ncbi:CASP-like protein 4D1 [Argentina anserina]|uniref:CASP-like protein 4D1 n=1 Tax=Argentina anserina TaxID=57926 RepID=UPI0021761DAA|nr:CASP-like protein 4D1 [Potentilla anserina]
MASMLPPSVARIVTIVLRVLIALISFATLMVLVTNSQDYDDVTDGLKRKTFRFTDSIGLEYMAAAIVIGIGYSIYGTVVMALRIKRGNDEGNLLIDFYGQKALSNLLVTAAVAGYLAIQSWKENMDKLQKMTNVPLATFDSYWGTYKTCCGLLILPFLLSMVVSILSTHTLTRRDY